MKRHIPSMLVCFALAVAMPTQAQKKKDKDKEKTEAPAAKEASKGPKPYKEVITAKAKSDAGLFTVHKVADAYFYEIPDSLFEREMLLVTRIAKTADNIGYGGEEANTSLVLLTVKPMMPRLKDQRVGYFSVKQNDYGLDAQKADEREYIVRWRLEPKDMAAFERGELVEPIKPITYYIDPATPDKWRPYIKQGVEDWQKAFEAAGFKNAIVCKYPPTAAEDPEFSPEDVRYSVIRYFASNIQNAYGPNVHDPRSGEILESDIGWYHNVMNLIRNWYFVQTAAINPDARTPKFKDEVMGRLIRFVSSHEVGHTLGLPHNMGSSAAYPVDSLRSATFTQKYNVSPSIMDYARFNYVAQPEDTGVSLIPNVGTYDKYAISWGYRLIPGAKKPEDEKATLNLWVLEHADDPAYRYGRQTSNPVDPRSQTEDIGDDAMKSSTYGIENLKKIVPQLMTWTNEKGKDYDDLEELYGQVLGQWNRYMGHVASNVGGIYETYKTTDQAGAVYTHVEREKQERALAFIKAQAFATPTWLIDNELLNRFEGVGMIERIRGAQERVLNNLLNPGRLARMIENQTLNGEKAYTLLAFMGDLRGGIWTELKGNRTADTYRRNLQRAYLDRLEYLMTQEPTAVSAGARSFVNYVPVRVGQSDIRAVVRGELNQLRADVKRAIPTTRDTMMKYHLQDVMVRIERILDPKE